VLATSLSGETRLSVVSCDFVLIEFFARPRTQSPSTFWVHLTVCAGPTPSRPAWRTLRTIDEWAATMWPPRALRSTEEGVCTTAPQLSDFADGVTLCARH